MIVKSGLDECVLYSYPTVYQYFYFLTNVIIILAFNSMGPKLGPSSLLGPVVPGTSLVGPVVLWDQFSGTSSPLGPVVFWDQ